MHTSFIVRRCFVVAQGLLLTFLPMVEQLYATTQALPPQVRTVKIAIVGDCTFSKMVVHSFCFVRMFVVFRVVCICKTFLFNYVYHVTDIFAKCAFLILRY